MIGGGAGTVSAAGGWLQGGGLSTGLERLYGFGVDQVEGRAQARALCRLLGPAAISPAECVV